MQRSRIGRNCYHFFLPKHKIRWIQKHNQLNCFLLKNFQEEEQLQRETKTFAAYNGYPPADDMYNRDKQEPDINPGDINKKKCPMS